MAKVYVWNFYYPKLAAVQAKMREVQRIVSAIAGKDWRVTTAGEEMLTICFRCDLTHSQLRDRIGEIGDEKLCHTLFEATSFVAGYGSRDVHTWLMLHLPYERTSGR